MEIKDMAYISAIAVLAIVLVFAFVDSANKYTADEVSSAINAVETKLNAQMDVIENKLLVTSEANAELSAKIAESDEQVAKLTADLVAANAEIEALHAEIEADVEEETVVEEEEKVESEIIDNLKFGDQVEFNIDDSELSKLIDDEIEFNDEDYDVHEEFIGYDTIVIGINGYGFDKEFSEEPMLVLAEKESLVYKYVFDDEIDMTEVSDEEPLEIVFLGEPMKIVKASKDELTVEFGKEILLNFGEAYVYNDMELVLLGASEDEAFVEYNEDTKSIDEGQTKNVGGIDVKVIDVFASDNYAFAKVVVGSEVEKDLKDNDEYLDDERFKFTIVSDDEMLKELIVSYDVKSDEVDDEYAPLKIGDKIVFPNEFITIEFTEITKVDYVDFEVYFDEFDAEDELLEDENGIVLEAGKAVIEIENDEYEEVYFMESGVYYVNDEDDFVKAESDLVMIVFDDFEYAVGLDEGFLLFEDSYGDVLKISVDIENKKLGTEEEKAEIDDVVYNGIGFGKLDYNLLLGSGVVVLEVEDNADRDEVKFKVPSEELEAIVTVF